MNQLKANKLCWSPILSLQNLDCRSHDTITCIGVRIKTMDSNYDIECRCGFLQRLVCWLFGGTVFV